LSELVTDRVGLALALAMLLSLGAVGIFDIVMTFGSAPGQTVSDYIHRWSQQFPLLPFLAGMLAGHLWFRS
jgi:hypothetical protein